MQKARQHKSVERSEAIQYSLFHGLIHRFAHQCFYVDGLLHVYSWFLLNVTASSAKVLDLPKNTY